MVQMIYSELITYLYIRSVLLEMNIRIQKDIFQ